MTMRGIPGAGSSTVSWDGGDETGDYDPVTDTGGQDRYAAAGDRRDIPAGAGFGSYIDEAGYEQPGRQRDTAEAGYEQPGRPAVRRRRKLRQRR